MPPNVSYEESDQTPVYGLEVFGLIHDVGYTDYDPVDCPYLSDWLIMIYCGNYEKFSEYLRGHSEDEIKELISKRETLMNQSAIFHVILGARIFYSDHPSVLGMQMYQKLLLDVKNDHMKILIKLLTLGADVNLKDMMGNTPLHCCQVLGHNPVTLKMADRLIRAGANVNARNRTGATPLHQSYNGTTTELVQLLLDNGADIYIEDNLGENRIDSSPPFIRDVIGAEEKKRAKEKRKLSKEAAGGSLRKCGKCGVVEAVMKRCTGCYLVFYCGRKCQLDHWDQHGPDCKKTQAEYKTFFIEDSQKSGKNHQTGKVFCRLSGERPKKSHFVVKVQISSENDELAVSTEDNELSGGMMIQRFTSASVKEIKQKIKKEGVNGTKGFFYAILPKDGKTKRNGMSVVELKINISKMQAIEVW